jgi:hypothetical protein
LDAVSQCPQTYLQTLLTSLDGGNVTGDTTTDDDEIVVSCCWAHRKSVIVHRGARGGIGIVPKKLFKHKLTGFRGITAT